MDVKPPAAWLAELDYFVRRDLRAGWAGFDVGCELRGGFVSVTVVRQCAYRSSLA
jgi:hypothetical protein